MKKAQISAPFQWVQNQHLGGGMDCVTASWAGVVNPSPTEKKQKFVHFSFIHNPPPLSLSNRFCDPSVILLLKISSADYEMDCKMEESSGGGRL